MVDSTNIDSADTSAQLDTTGDRVKLQHCREGGKVCTRVDTRDGLGMLHQGPVDVQLSNKQT